MLPLIIKINYLISVQCGTPAIQPEKNARIAGGTKAIPNSHPWIAFLELDLKDYCSGALINNQWLSFKYRNF